MIWNNCQVDEAEFKETMKKFASDVLAKGATPVICSPVADGMNLALREFAGCRNVCIDIRCCSVIP